MAAEVFQHKTLRFGEFELDAERGALLRGTEEVRLRPQSLDVLWYLAGNANRLVTKEELFRAVWGDTVVTDDSLTQCLVEVRRALGDESHELIRTVPRRGYVFEMPVGAASDPPAAAERRAPARWLLAATAVAVAALVLWWSTARMTGEAPAPANTIAVLAFADMSERGDQQYFADGIAEEILNLLARIPELRVVARTSSFSFRDADADVGAIGRALDVGYLLEGSVRRSGDRVRVTAQLVEVASGAHVWSENYDRELGELLAVQTDIAQTVATALRVTLAEGALVAGRGPVDPLAYEQFLQGQFLHNRRSAGDAALAEARFRQAIAIDPDYAAAWAGLAGALLAQIAGANVDAEALLEEMRVAALRAVALDPSLAEAQLRAAHYYAMAGGNGALAQQHFDKAVALGPGNPVVLGSAAGMAARRGYHDRAVEYAERAAALDPLGAVTRGNLSNYLAAAGRFADAWGEWRRAEELSPEMARRGSGKLELLVLLGRYQEALDFAGGLPDGVARERGLALAYRGLGREYEARAAVERLAASADPMRWLALAEVEAHAGNVERALELLPRARDGLDATASLPGQVGRVDEIVTSAFLRPLHGDPRWQALLEYARTF
jgi:TolB-like protein/DNA-binding winged helix-turn-helix (wHTH) protein/Tfp pilus assembly protein PilF